MPKIGEEKLSSLDKFAKKTGKLEDYYVKLDSIYVEVPEDYQHGSYK